jgi:hypothetical protein
MGIGGFIGRDDDGLSATMRGMEVEMHFLHRTCRGVGDKIMCVASATCIHTLASNKSQCKVHRGAT